MTQNTPDIVQASPLGIKEVGTLLAVWGGAALALIILAASFLRSQRAGSPNDKDLEASRLIYGFWLIIGSLFLTLGVVVIATTTLRPPQTGTADMLAIITAVTGVIATLVAAFFGVQAAGAGRSQALSTLAQFQSQAQPTDSQSKMDPSYGPHVGGTRVSVTGNGFTNASAMNFGTTPGTHFEVVNDGLVRANTAPAPAGKDTVDISVIFPTATPPNRSIGTFYYYTIEPSAALAGATIDIKGAGLTTATGVRFGTADPVVPVHEADGRIRVTVPPAPAGMALGDEVDISVVFPVDTPTNSAVIGKFKYGDATVDSGEESDVDGCDVTVADPTPDEGLPASTGGVA